jgi:hypothetical protein
MALPSTNSLSTNNDLADILTAILVQTKESNKQAKETSNVLKKIAADNKTLLSGGGQGSSQQQTQEAPGGLATRLLLETLGKGVGSLITAPATPPEDIEQKRKISEWRQEKPASILNISIKN